MHRPEREPTMKHDKTPYALLALPITLIAVFSLIALSGFFTPEAWAQDKGSTGGKMLNGDQVSAIRSATHPLQVFLEVNIFEVLLTNQLDIGFVYDLLGEAGDFRGTSLSGDPVTESDLSVLQPGNRNQLLPSGANVVARVFDGNESEVLATIQALAQDQMVRVHANPILLTISGYPAKLKAGDDIPFLSRINIGDAITLETKFRETGVNLEITPWVQFLETDVEKKNPFIYVTIDAELNSITRYREEEGFLQPITDTRQYKSSVWLKAGERILIGSLFKDTKLDKIRGIPLLMDIPILGRLFRGTTESTTISQLFVMIRPAVLNIWDNTSSLIPLEQQSKMIREFLNQKTLDLEPKPDPLGEIRDLFLDNSAPEQ
ncbi:MAG: hypothetical protein GC154_02070 [bacterium]|nr:hypothetical protein [bacterium]